MYAIIETGGKQYRVEKNDIIDIELIKDLKNNKTVEFNNILLFNDGKDAKVGSPYLKDCKVLGEIIKEEVKGPKVIAFKYRRRKDSKKKIGHRQKYVKVKINELKSV